MQKKYLSLLAISIFLIFSFGVLVGAFKIPPYNIANDIFDQFFYDRNNQIITKLSNPNFDISSIISIQNENDIIQKRQELISYIYKNSNDFNTKILTNIEQNFIDENFMDLKNLKTIDKFFIQMEFGVTSNAYLFLPKTETKNLVIYHQGHAGDFLNGKNTIEFLLENNYAVLAFSMPLIGQNSNPVIELEDFGNFRLNYHDDLIFLESENFSPLKFFTEPISSSLNYLDENYSFNHYYMIGISGGGWITGVYSALDPRIEKSFIIAGTAPMFLRLNNPENFGDYEQRVPTFYRIANYLEQYIMSSTGNGREQLQIFNKNDPCCFSGNDFLLYEDDIQNVLSSLESGQFSIYIDENNLKHSISEDALNVILKKLEN